MVAVLALGSKVVKVVATVKKLVRVVEGLAAATIVKIEMPTVLKESAGVGWLRGGR
jgi:hypothetical protein